MYTNLLLLFAGVIVAWSILRLIGAERERLIQSIPPAPPIVSAPPPEPTAPAKTAPPAKAAPPGKSAPPATPPAAAKKK